MYGMNKLLIGFSAGLLVGILFAPAKGTETRETIARRGRELKDQFNDLVDSISDKFDSMAEKAGDLAEMNKEKIRSYSADLG